MRREIASRYLGPEAGEKFADERRSTPGVLLRLYGDNARGWDLSAILPE